MPLYEYECDKCHYRKEILCLKLEDLANANLAKVCPKCKKGMLRKIMSAFAHTPLKWKVDK